MISIKCPKEMLNAGFRPRLTQVRQCVTLHDCGGDPPHRKGIVYSLLDLIVGSAGLADRLHVIVRARLATGGD